MIHDLDIVLSLDGSEAVQVDAVGVPVLTPKVDIANARLRFASGLIANLTASRVSAEKVRKFRVFAPRTYVSVDFAAREAQVYRLCQESPGRPEIAVERTAAPDEEPLRRQLAGLRAGGPRRDRPRWCPGPTAGGRWPWPWRSWRGWLTRTSASVRRLPDTDRGTLGLSDVR